MLHNFAPLWDEALESLLVEAVLVQENGLQVSDLEELSLANAIRIGDILETLFLMTIYGQWIYVNTEGHQEMLDQGAMDSLFAKGRISVDDLGHLTGAWRPKS